MEHIFERNSQGSTGLMVSFLRKKKKEKADQDSKLTLSHIYTLEAAI